MTALFSFNRDRLVNALRRKSVDLALYSAHHDSKEYSKVPFRHRIIHPLR